MNENEFSSPGAEFSAPCEEFVPPSNEFFEAGQEQYALGPESNQTTFSEPPKKRRHRVPPIFAAAAAITVACISLLPKGPEPELFSWRGTGYFEQEHFPVATTPFGFDLADSVNDFSFRVISCSGMEVCDLTQSTVPDWAAPLKNSDDTHFLAARILPGHDPNQKDFFFRAEVGSNGELYPYEYHIVAPNGLPGVRYEPCTIRQGEPFLLTDYIHLPDKPGFSRSLGALLAVESTADQVIPLQIDPVNPVLHTLTQEVDSNVQYRLRWTCIWENGNPDDLLFYIGTLPVTIESSAVPASTPVPAPTVSPAPTSTPAPSLAPEAALAETLEIAAPPSAVPVEQLAMDPTIHTLDDSRAATGSLKLVDRTEMFSSYDYYGGFSNGWAPVVKGDRFGYLSEQGEERMLYSIPLQDLFQKFCQDWTVPIPLTPELEARWTEHPLYIGWDDMEDPTLFAQNQTYHYLHTQFACSKEGIVPYWKDGLWGYCNLDGQVLVEPKYGFVTPFGEYGAGGFMSYRTTYSSFSAEQDGQRGSEKSVEVEWLDGRSDTISQLFTPYAHEQTGLFSDSASGEIGVTYFSYITGKNVDFYNSAGELIANEPCVQALYPQQGYCYLEDCSDYGISPNQFPTGLVRVSDGQLLLPELLLTRLYNESIFVPDSSYNRPLPGGFVYGGVVFDRNWKVHSGNYRYRADDYSPDYYGGSQIPIGFTSQNSFVCRDADKDILTIYPAGKAGVQIAADYGLPAGEDLLVHTPSGHMLRVDSNGQLTSEQPMLLAVLSETNEQTGLLHFEIVDQNGQKVAALDQTGANSHYRWDHNVLQEGEWLMFQTELGAPFKMYQVQK